MIHSVMHAMCDMPLSLVSERSLPHIHCPLSSAAMAPTDHAPSLALDSKAVVVLTGCSRGLGLGLAKGFLESTECIVVATARNPKKAVGLQELQAKYPDRLQLEALDTFSEDSVKV